jgi:hypothetical protein
LHIEDCRQAGQRAKLESGEEYLFVSLKLLALERVLNATRHIAFQLRHVPNPVISKDLSPFLRDVNDDLAIILDLISAGA